RADLALRCVLLVLVASTGLAVLTFGAGVAAGAGGGPPNVGGGGGALRGGAGVCRGGGAGATGHRKSTPAEESFTRETPPLGGENLPGDPVATTTKRRANRKTYYDARSGCT